MTLIKVNFCNYVINISEFSFPICYRCNYKHATCERLVLFNILLTNPGILLVIIAIVIGPCGVSNSVSNRASNLKIGGARSSRLI